MYYEAANVLNNIFVNGYIIMSLHIMDIMPGWTSRTEKYFSLLYLCDFIWKYEVSSHILFGQRYYLCATINCKMQ